MTVPQTTNQSKTVLDADSLIDRVTMHRSDVERQTREILRIERDRDLALRRLDADLAEVERVHLTESGRLLRLIRDTKSQAHVEIERCNQLKRSSELALSGLETNAAQREAPMTERRVPRMVPADVTGQP